jgi:hypothetical protein
MENQTNLNERDNEYGPGNVRSDSTSQQLIDASIVNVCKLN